MKSSRMFLVAVICLLGACDHEAMSGGIEPCDPYGVCPPGYTCQDGYCYGSTPTECDLSDPQYAGWPNDSDLEPNDHPDDAVVLPCGDDAVFADPQEYLSRCPSRMSYVNGYMNLVICPPGDRDFLAVYLLPEESLQFNLMYMYAYDPPRDLDARVWTWDFIRDDWRDDVAVGLSTNDNEELTVSTGQGSSNVQGWYYLEVFGKTLHDMNFYTVSFTLNP